MRAIRSRSPSAGARAICTSRCSSPGRSYDDAAEPDADDGGGGLYDLDPQDTFDVDQSGTWHIVVGAWDASVAGYELTVRDAA